MRSRRRNVASTETKQRKPRTRSNALKNDDDDEVTHEEDLPRGFAFNGKIYDTYQEMVDAKRQRNLDMLHSTGLLEAKAAIDRYSLEKKRSVATVRGLKRSRDLSSSQTLPPRRKSSRIAGVAAENIYVDSESHGKIYVASHVTPKEQEVKFYKDRVNDGADLSISEAVQLSGTKWAVEGAVESAEKFTSKVLPEIINEYQSDTQVNVQRSPTSVAKGETLEDKVTSKSLFKKINSLTVDDPDSCVAKVTPDRIYSACFHPSPNSVLACVGDKAGHIGIWNVDHCNSSDDLSTDGNTPATKSSFLDGVHLFKPHNGPVSQLLWDPSGTSLLSSSYDGSVRLFDAANQTFQEIFATYDDSDEYAGKIGHGLDVGYTSWIQYMELDHKNSSGGDCFFLSTSEGSVIHVDLRKRGSITFNQELSEKKINTVSLHPNGHTLATAGLSARVDLWDVRNMGGTSTKVPKPLAQQYAGRSINSAFFSPSGKRLLTTTMADTLDILVDAHLSSGMIKSPDIQIKHDNKTGRWLSTFMAKWHTGFASGDEIFVVGSMQRPRTMEIFNGVSGKLISGIRGDGITAVVSRCCFHPRSDEILVLGGSSSGRVTLAR